MAAGTVYIMLYYCQYVVNKDSISLYSRLLKHLKNTIIDKNQYPKPSLSQEKNEKKKQQKKPH